MSGEDLLGAALTTALLSLSLCLTRGASAATPADAEVVLVRDGVATAAIVLPPEPTGNERLAATELQTHLQMISGAELPILADAEEAIGVRILIGGAAPRSLADAIRPGGTDPASFRLVVRPGTVAMVGLFDQGTLFAAYELLEQLGVRWFIPGDLGTVIPKARTVAAALQDTIQRPAFAARILDPISETEWKRRLRLGGLSPGAHGFPFAPDPQTRPELFAHENGRPTGQLRVSSPEVLRQVIAACRAALAPKPGTKPKGLEEGVWEHLPCAYGRDPASQYISMGPNDGAGFGSDPWDADDMDPLNGRLSVTDRYIRFYNLVLEDLQRDYPKVGIAFFCYSNYMRPPVREKPNPRILPVFAPIDVCRFHSIDNPRCWERHSYLDWVVDRWRSLGVEMVYRGYLFNLADPGMPISMIRQVRTEIPYYHRKGMIAWTQEIHPMWAYHAPALYLAAKMLWNPDLDVDATLDEYFTKLYGPAATAMRAHFDCLEEAYYRADCHAGNVFDMPHILTPPVMAELSATLRQAEQAVPAGSVQARRVHLTRLGFDFGQVQLAMMAAVNAHDFVEAHRLLTRLNNEIIPRGLENRPPALVTDYGATTTFMARFWEPLVKQGYERVTGGNEVVAKLPDTWMVMLESSGAGEGLGLEQPEVDSSSWMPLRTYSRSWSSQGLRYYKGDAWYRTSAVVDEQYRGRKVRLWLGGVDDQAAAWLNGQPLPVITRGEAPIGVPWEFDATDAVAFGKPNVVVVKVTNGRLELQEIGTGGLTGPAMLWAAAAP
ncbi:MAG: DUF4838 domain-containing protein [Candidatus Latescibacterota bacterium]|jgi:hypothetical protein